MGNIYLLFISLFLIIIPHITYASGDGVVVYTLLGLPLIFIFEGIIVNLIGNRKEPLFSTKLFNILNAIISPIIGMFLCINIVNFFMIEIEILSNQIGLYVLFLELILYVIIIYCISGLNKAGYLLMKEKLSKTTA